MKTEGVTMHPDAQASDPRLLGWMAGSPPPPERVISLHDGSFGRFPQLRWSFSHYRQLFPTKAMARGQGPVCELPRRERDDIDALRFQPLGGTSSMSWSESLAANYTDGIVVLHRGHIVHERYFGALEAQGQHIAMSVTKSFVGLLGAMLIAQGVLDERAPMAHYVPELGDSAFGDATLRQVLDMTTGLDYSEDYVNPGAGIRDCMHAARLTPRASDYAGPEGLYPYLGQVRKLGEHGRGFVYKTINTDALAWVISRVSGKAISALLSERLWSQLGAEQDASFTVDGLGVEFTGGGLNLGLRDLARFGEMMRQGGFFNGRQIVPREVIEGIRRGASKEHFAMAGYPLLPGWSYRNMWWITHNEHGAYCARGVHGQAIYVDPKAEMTIARFGSHPMAANSNLDPTSLPAFHALAKHLVASSA